TLGLDVLSLPGVLRDTTAQAQDLNVDRTVENLCAVQAREIEQLIARKHPLRGGTERLQQTEFPSRGHHGPPFRGLESTRADIDFPPVKSIRANFFAGRSKLLAGSLVPP